MPHLFQPTQEEIEVVTGQKNTKLKNKFVRVFLRIPRKGRLAILFAAIIALLSFFNLQATENEKADADIVSEKRDSVYTDKISKLEARNEKLQSTVDSFRGESNVSQKGYQDSLKSATFSLTNLFISGTKTILVQAQKDAEQLRDTIKVLKERQQPHIVSGENPMKHEQVHDTFYIFPAIENGGGSVARDVSYTIYFLMNINNKTYEYFELIGEAMNMDIPVGKSKVLLKGTGSYMTNFHFDSTNREQYILIIGSYTNDDQKNIVKKDFTICYSWTPESSRWGDFGDPKMIERAHNSKNLLRFRHFP